MKRMLVALALASSAALAGGPPAPQQAGVTAADFAYPGSKTYTPRKSFSKAQKQGHEASAGTAEKVVAGTSLLAYSTADSVEKVLAHYADVGAKKGMRKYMEQDIPRRAGKLNGYMGGTPMRIVSVQVYSKCGEDDLMDGERPPANQRLIYVDVTSL